MSGGCARVRIYGTSISSGTAVVGVRVSSQSVAKRGDSSGGVATSGDSATAFFNTGTIEAARLPNLEGLVTAFTAGSVPFSTGTIMAQDNANFFWNDGSNFLGIGTAIPVTELSVFSSSAADPRGIMTAQFTTDAVGSRLHFRKARGTSTVPTTVVTGDMLGRMRFSGYDGSNYLQMGSIDVGSSGTIAATRVPTYMAFSTATDATPSVLTERMRIINNGNVVIGTTVPSGRLEVYGTSVGSDINEYITNSDITNSGSSASLRFKLGVTERASISSVLGAGVTPYLAFSNTGSERMRIDSSGNVGIADDSPTEGKLTVLSDINAATYETRTNCADSAGAAACGSASAGSVVIDASATSVVVSTTSVTADSQIFAMFDSSLGTRLSVTCNTTAALPTISARTAATSFTILVAAAPAINPACFSYRILN